MTGGVAARDEKPDRSSTQHLLRWLLLDDAQEPRPGVLLLDATSTGGTDGNGDRGSVSRRSPALAGIIGALRAWTVAMISALSIPCG
jgi:hypothetical protein